MFVRPSVTATVEAAATSSPQQAEEIIISDATTSSNLGATSGGGGGGSSGAVVRYYFHIGSVDSFERKLDEAQRELGITSAQMVPVKWVAEDGRKWGFRGAS